MQCVGVFRGDVTGLVCCLIDWMCRVIRKKTHNVGQSWTKSGKYLFSRYNGDRIFDRNSNLRIFLQLKSRLITFAGSYLRNQIWKSHGH